MPSPNVQRTALITGAAGDLGTAIAIRLAEEGYRIAVTDLESRRSDLQKTADAVEKAGSKCFLVTGDVTKEEDVQNIVAETVNHLGHLEVMVSNVGKFYGSPITNFSTSDWDDLFNVNVKSMMLCYKTAANQILKQIAEDKGRDAHYRIIGGCSVAGYTGAPLCGGYAASKFAIRGLTQATASELGPSGITVNAYAPGFIGDTKMVDKLDKTVSSTFNLPDGIWRAQATDSIKMKKLGETKHIAGIVSYLASPDADWTTGQAIVVDGGMFLA